MTIRMLLLPICLLTAIPAMSQSEKKEIELSVDALTRAIVSRDKTVLDSLTAEKLSYGHSTGVVEDKTAFEKNIVEGPLKFTSIQNTGQSVSVSENEAIVRNISTIKGDTNGVPLDIKIGILMIWQKQGKTWKLLARQGYKLP